MRTPFGKKRSDQWCHKSCTKKFQVNQHWFLCVCPSSLHGDTGTCRASLSFFEPIHMVAVADEMEPGDSVSTQGRIARGGKRQSPRRCGSIDWDLLLVAMDSLLRVRAIAIDRVPSLETRVCWIFERREIQNELQLNQHSEFFRSHTHTPFASLLLFARSYAHTRGKHYKIQYTVASRHVLAFFIIQLPSWTPQPPPRRSPRGGGRCRAGTHTKRQCASRSRPCGLAPR